MWIVTVLLFNPAQGIFDGDTGYHSISTNHEFSPFISEPWALSQQPPQHMSLLRHAEESAMTTAICSNVVSCEECNTYSSFCHWCESDDTCHVIGSPHGCMVGSKCSGTHDNSDDDKKRKDDPNQFTNTSSTCNQVESCEECNSFHTCHWCNKDMACHAIGSPHGCLVGSSCDKKKNDDDKRKKDGCFVHTTCAECALASTFCHWCAHDNACHSKGSVYGCVTGVDCYDISHCKRTTPEPLHPHANYNFANGIGPFPLLVIFISTSTLLCCVTACGCMASGIKGAYDDLADIAARDYHRRDWDSEGNMIHRERERLDVTEGQDILTSSSLSRSIDAPSTRVAARRSERAIAREAARAERRSARDQQEQVAITNCDRNEETKEEDFPVTENDNEDRTEETRRLLDDEEEAVPGNYVRMQDEQEVEQRTQAPVRELLHPFRRPFRFAPRTHMQRLYNACVGCYLVSVAIILLCAFSSIRYFPKKPVYNICNDAIAWKSIIDSMTSMKVSADFEILASISNPNHFDVAVDMGKGAFYHDGAFVGTYEIPPVVVEAMSITDILIVASFAPEKWDALSITAQYYKGTLVLHVDSETTIRVPALADYTFTATLRNLIVHVNELSDRSLCACPTWSDAQNRTMLQLPVPQWAEDTSFSVA